MPLTPPAQAIIDAFGARHRVKPERLKYLRQAIDASPALIDQLNEAVAKGQLRSIAALNDPHAGGNYVSSRGELQIPLTALEALPSVPFTGAAIITVLAHELQHALDADALMQAHFRLALDSTAIAKAPFLAEHDYTAPIATYLSSMRLLEAKAEISVWNAAVSAVRAKETSSGPSPLESVYAWNRAVMRRSIDVDRSRYPATYSLKPNLEVDQQLAMTFSGKNLEGMGHNYFDLSRSLGHHGNSSYANLYGAHAIGVALRAERRAHPVGPDHGVRIDMGTLMLSPRTVAENGINLGRNTAPMPYVDRGTDPSRRSSFWHTAHSHTYPPSLESPAASLEERRHPDNALYQDALRAVRRMHEEQGMPARQSDKNLAAALVVSARRDGIGAIHRVVAQGNKVFGVQDPPMKKIIEVHRDAAERSSIKDSSEELRRWRRQNEPHGGQGQSIPPIPAPRRAIHPPRQR